jgi:hypothetical protein
VRVSGRASSHVKGGCEEEVKDISVSLAMDILEICTS